MSKFWETEHQHNFAWADVAKAYWMRYPNPNSKHVFSEDFIEVKLENRILYTKRFITKTNKLPSWGKHFFSANRVPMIEETTVDPVNKIMTTYTRNIGLRYFMGVTERVVFEPSPDNEESLTRVRKEVWIESDVFGFQTAIKKFGVDRFKKNCVLATEGFDYVLKKLYKGTNSNNSKNPGGGGSSKPANSSAKQTTVHFNKNNNLIS